jgi:hypothetical protein
MPLRVPSDPVLSRKRPIPIGNLPCRLPRPPRLVILLLSGLANYGLTALHVQADHHGSITKDSPLQMCPAAPIRRMNPDDRCRRPGQKKKNFYTLPMEEGRHDCQFKNNGARGVLQNDFEKCRIVRRSFALMRSTSILGPQIGAMR